MSTAYRVQQCHLLSLFSASTSYGRQPASPLLQGAGHQHRQRPPVLEGPSTVPQARNVGRQASQQNSAIELVQSSEAPLARTHGN